MQYLKTGLHLFAVPDAFAMANSMYLKLSNMESYLRHHHSTDKLTLSQTNLENDPEQIAASIMEFLGEPVCNDIRKFCRNMRRKSSVKDWRQDLKPDEIAAVESVFLPDNNNLDWHPVYNVKKNRWVEKAAEIKTLIHGSTQKLSTIIREICPLFKNQNEKRSLGYTLVQFGTYEHIRKNFDRSCIYFEKASLHIPEAPILWIKFAELCFDQKSLQQARKYYQTALQSLPKSDYFRFVRAKAVYQLGKIERLQGSLIKAGEYFRKSLAIFPQYKIARKMLESVSA